MPYSSNEQLPQSVRDSLPAHGQDIYRAAFNNAWDEYKEPQSRRTKESREVIAHKVAWSAVKQKYRKLGNKWEEKLN